MRSNKTEFPYREISPEQIEFAMRRAEWLRNEAFYNMCLGAVRIVRQAFCRLLRVAPQSAEAVRKMERLDYRELTGHRVLEMHEAGKRCTDTAAIVRKRSPDHTDVADQSRPARHARA